MDRRILAVAVLSALLSGCASLGAPPDVLMPPAPTPAAEAPTPSQDYDAGALLHTRGDDEGARRHWMRCIDDSSAASPERLDCLVALERLAPLPQSRTE